jgi:hypothetical protein
MKNPRPGIEEPTDNAMPADADDGVSDYDIDDSRSSHHMIC